MSNYILTANGRLYHSVPAGIVGGVAVTVGATVVAGILESRM